ncbi:MAG: efflux RND transporter periplasmic adaptor subunit [Phycisphaerales bacterium]|nr:MAG: efflux RND transporter periplasmic adaptor subunit [Phycisphaerales bacterium]
MSVTDAARGAVLAVACLLFLLASAPTHAQPAALVRVDEVRLERVDRWRQVSGDVRSLRRSLIAAQEEGHVLEVNADEGDEIPAGRVIARLDPVFATLERDRAAADAQAREGFVAERRADLERARRDLLRFEEGRRSGATSDVEFDQASTRVSIFEAQLAQAEADAEVFRKRAEDAAQRLERFTIRAPFNGVVARKETEVGRWLNRGDPVVELVSLDLVEARIDVPEALVDRIRDPEVRIRIRIPALDRPDPEDPQKVEPHELELPITAVVPDVDPLSRLFPVRVVFDNTGQRAKPGMSVIGLVPTGSRGEELTVHKDAILRDDAGEFIYINAGGQAMPVRIRSRYGVGDRVVIGPHPELGPGVQAIIEGNERLFPTQPVRVAGEERPRTQTPGEGA